MNNFYLFTKEIVLIFLFFLLVIIEYNLIIFGFIYLALFDGFIAFFIGIYTLKLFIKKIRMNRR